MKKPTSFMQGWILPTVTSGTAGFIVFVLASIVCGLAKQSEWYAAIAGVSIWGLAFWDLVNRYGGHMMRVMTLQVTPPPVIMPEQPMQPQPMPTTIIEINHRDEDGNLVSGDFARLLTDGDSAGEFARGLTEGRTFSSRAWAGPGRLFTNGQFDAIRDEMLARGLAEWKVPGVPQQGVRLTEIGKRVLKGLAKRTPPLLDRARDA